MRQQALVARPIEIAFFMSLIVSAGFLLAAPWLAVPAAAAGTARDRRRGGARLRRR